MTGRTSYEKRDRDSEGETGTTGTSGQSSSKSGTAGSTKRSGRTSGMTESVRKFGRKTGMRESEEYGADIALLGAAGSVLLAWFLFYGRGRREHGLFVGLWPPTILAFASYLRGRGIAQRLEKMTPGDDDTGR
ncbi:hypothetical protein [Halomarina litorea]|uniref:hypothetical protein n=1 Tax=Halomarina litorea TaxID=2961595 RepID=UPI0020C5A7D3|nr:hypothetical protein [Halomarina sp. BCD28]